MDPQQIATIFVKINAKLDTLKTFEERLIKVKDTHKPPESPTGDQTLPKNNRLNNNDNPPNLYAQYLNSIRSRSPTLMDITIHNFS